MAKLSIGLELGQLESWLTEARRLEEQHANCLEHIAQCTQTERLAVRNQEDATWVRDLRADYQQQAVDISERLSELNVKIQSEISRLEGTTSRAIGMQLELAHFLDDHGRDGSTMAQRASLLTPTSVDEALVLSVYLSSKNCYPDAIRAARQGWQRFGGRILRSQWAELLEIAGPDDDLIQLLSEDLRQTPDDLSLMERLARHLLRAGRSQEAFDIMALALAHPAGGTHLLASFMMDLTTTGYEVLAVTLAGHYVRGLNNRVQVCHELVEILRRNDYLQTALAFLDQQVEVEEGGTGEGEIGNYRTVFLVNSVRSDRPNIRHQAISLLHIRRDRSVESQLSKLFDTTRGDELRLVIVNALAAIQGPDALPFLGHALTSNARRVRLAAAREIGGIGAPEGRKLLTARLDTEPDDGVRQAITEALHQVDPRPRRPWERLAGTRPWAEVTPQAPPLPTPGRRRRQITFALVVLAVMALVALAFAPLEPSPRKLALGYGQQAAGLVSTQIAKRRATATPQPLPSPTPTRAEARVDTASGQVGEVTAGDTVRVQLSGQTAIVRYLGIEVPAAGQPGARAVLDANRRLVATRLVYLEAGAIQKDSSGRWLRYVWLPEGQMANVKLLEMGLAAPAPDMPDTKYQQQLTAAATKAWQDKAGFWKGGTDVFPMAAVRSVDANVREAPGTNQPVKLQVKQGTVLPLIGRNAGKDWVAVKIPGYATGWMSAQVIDTTVPVANLPLAP